MYLNHVNDIGTPFMHKTLKNLILNDCEFLCYDLKCIFHNGKL